MKKLLLGGALSGAIKIGSAGLTFLMFLLLARILGPAEYGKFGTMFALGSVGAIAALLGQHTLSIKIIAGLEDAQNAGRARNEFVRRSLLTVLAGGVGCIVILLTVWASELLFGWQVGGAQALGACLFLLPFALAELVSHHYRAFGSISFALIPRDIIWRGSIVLLCLAATALPSVFSSALSAMMTISLVLMGIVGVQMVLMYRVFASRFTPTSKQETTPPTPPIPWWMWLASLVAMGANLNVVLAAAFLPPEQVGAYFAAQKTAQLLQLPILAINIVAAPTFARLYARGDFAALRDVSRKLALILVLPLVVGAGILVAFAPQILALFDPTFDVAVTALIILALSYLVMGLGGPARQLMLMADGDDKLVMMTAAAEVIGLALVPILVPMIGLIGAAIAALAAKAIFIVVAVAWCRQKLGVDTSVFALLSRPPQEQP